MIGPLARGLAAGAAGSTVGTALEHLGTALQRRPPAAPPDRPDDAADSRRAALTALTAIGNGVAVGVLASTVRAAGVRLPGPLGALAAGAVSMGATDAQARALRRDVARPSAAAWAVDAVPHLAYGAAVQAVLSALPTDAERRRPRHAAGAGLTARAGLLGVAAGCRSSLGLAGPTLLDRHRLPGVTASGARQAASLVAIGGEMVADKLPRAPARTDPPSMAARLASGAGGAARLAAREDANGALPAFVGMAGALAGTWGGIAWRRWAGARRADWQGALVEDVIALALAGVACLTGPRPRATLRLVPPVESRSTA